MHQHFQHFHQHHEDHVNHLRITVPIQNTATICRGGYGLWAMESGDYDSSTDENAVFEEHVPNLFYYSAIFKLVFMYFIFYTVYILAHILFF